ncbi:hypothetical protein Tco_0731748 [Tanacetum coccineum]
MHTSKDDYLINSLRFVFTKESTQIYGAILPECLTSPAMKESKAYKTYLGYATGAVPRKMAQKFKKASPSKKDSDLVPVDEKPVQKGKRVKSPAKKSTTKPAAGIVIREAPVETKSKSKEKEKTHPSGFGTVSEKPQSVDKITPTVTSEGTGNKPGVPDVTEDDSTESNEQENESEEQESNSEQEEESKDDDQEEEEFVHTPTDEKDDDNLESESDDAIKKPTQTDKEKTEVLVTSSSRSSDLASKFLNFLDIPYANVEIASPLDVHVHHEVPRTQVPTLLIISVYVITESSPVYTNIPQSSQTFTPPPILTTPNPPPTIETTNPLSTLPDFASVFRFNDRITTLEKEVAELKKDPLHTQVTTLVDEHLDTRLGETREEFMKFLSESLTTRIKEQVKDQLPQILPKEVSNFTSPVIQKLIKESRDEVTLAKVSSQPHYNFEATSTLTEFELKKILIDKMEKSESYLAAPEHRDCYDSLKKSYDLDKDFFFSYDVYSLKRGRKDKDKDEDPSAGSDRGLKKRKTSKDAEPTTGPKNKDSTSSSSKGTKSQPKPSGKSVQSEEPVFKVADSDMPQDQEEYPGDNDDEPRKEDASRRDWFKKPTPPQEPTDPDWHEGKESLFNQRNQCSRLQTQTCHKIKKGIWVTIKMRQGMRLPLDVTGSRNHLKNPLTLTVNQTSFFARRHYQEYRHGVLTKEKMEHIRKEKSSFHDQGHQQATKGKEDDEDLETTLLGEGNCNREAGVKEMMVAIGGDKNSKLVPVNHVEFDESDTYLLGKFDTHL